MKDKELRAALARFVDERGIAPVMAACHVSESTVRRWIDEARLPVNDLVRSALVDLLTKAATR